MSTIQDVARAAGVSTATVSRLLNKSANVNEDTADKIMSAIKELNYEPNLLGKGLRAKKTNMILVIISTIVNTFYAKVLKGIEDEANKNGYNIIIASNYDDNERENTYLSLLKNKLVDGAIIMRPTMTAAGLDALYEKFPVVQCVEYLADSAAPFVSINNYKAAFEVCENLIESGHKKIGIISYEYNLISAAERERGCRDALKKYGLSPYIEYGNLGYKKSYAAACSLIEKGVSAIFAFSDKMAGASISAARDMGFEVPEKLAVIGFDNTEISKITVPQISTVSQNQHEMGALAFQKLLAVMEGNKNIKSEFVEYSFVQRGSF